MNEDKFWDIVDFIGWGKICKKDRAYDEGKAMFMDQVETLEGLEAFRKVFSEKHNALYQAFDQWEKDGQDWHAHHNPRSFGLGDDSFGDLIAHCIGLGREEYKACLADPERAHKRALAYDFSESFSYCIPYKEDYDSPQEKLARAQDGLTYWIKRLVESPEYTGAHREVERRAMEIAKLQAQVDGTEVSPKAVNELVKQAQLQAQESLVAALQEELTELQERLYTEKNKLAQMKG